ncbi:MAG TPA: hypothetical protein H9845_03575 [Candidatus Agathobaculum pullicola]|nr:hypothetical protein [Candidatus Agathobaculum pullicola]
MSLKPILFNTEMVRTLIEGRKTVTRRVVKPQPEGRPVPMPADSCWPGYFAIQGTERVVRPPYQHGDVLYVRETWAKNPFGEGYIYPTEVAGAGQKWRPSIHMPRKAARIFLRVTSVRVERLQAITEEDAKAEGAEKMHPCTDPETGKTAFLLHENGTYRAGFSQIWDSTIPKRPSLFERYLYYWEYNPWVWVIEFERIEKELVK